MSTLRQSYCESILADLQNLWQGLDELLDSLGPGDWSRKHGKDWTFADVPYHLSYFDHALIARGIERGPNVPAQAQRILRTTRELDAWNAEQFAERPEGQTPHQSVAQMWESRELIRHLIGSLTDTELDRPVHIPLPGIGWTTARMALDMCRAHTWSHYTQLRLHMRRSAPLPSNSATRNSLALYMRVLPMMMNRERAANTRFTVVMSFTGPSGGDWTLHVADGACTLTDGRVERADLVMTQSPETFLKTFAGMHNPLVAMLTGKIKVRGFRKLGTFSKLFPEPKPDEVWGSFSEKAAA